MTQRKIKFLFAINALGVGGAETLVVEQANWLDAKQFDTHLISLYPTPPHNVTGNIKLPEGRYSPFAFRNIFDLPSWWKLYQFMRKERFDCVLTNLYDANLIVRVVAILTGVRCILSYEHNIYHDKRRWQIVADRILARWNYRILVGAPQVKEFIIAQEHLPSSLVEVVFDSADLAFEHVKEDRTDVLKSMRLPEDHLYVVAAGRFNEQKGHEYLIKAWKQLIAHYKDTKTKLTLVIFGIGGLKQPLEDLAKGYGLEESVVMPGIAPMKDILAISDIFSLISLWEGFSIALIQAMNSGSAILATKVSGSVDAIRDGIEGLLVEPKDAAAAAAALVRLIDDQGLRQRLGLNAQKRSQLYHVKNRIKEIESLALDCLKRQEGYNRNI